MKKALCIIIPLCLALTLASCAGKNKKNADSLDNNNTEDTSVMPGKDTDGKQPGEDTTAPGTYPDNGNADEPVRGDILKNISADLNDDGIQESVNIVRVPVDSGTSEQAGEFEGRLIIRGNSIKRDVLFARKADGLTGLISDLIITDLDGDGAKDVFIIIPETGNPFTLNYFFMYNYKTDKSYPFSTDSNLTAFARSFKFNYKGKGTLEISNEKYKFNADIKLAGMEDISAEDDEFNKQYSNSWVEPVPSEINSDSRLELVEKNGKVEIKVPLPIYGTSTVDVIGEVDAYYSVNEDFEPAMTRFEVLSINGSNKKIGEKLTSNIKN